LGRITRRRFLKSAAATAVASAALPALARPIWRGAEKTQLNVGLVGVNGRGMDHVRDIARIGNANIVALCDVDSHALPLALKHAPDAATFTDFRQMLQIKHLDAVCIAIPDHSHAVVTAAALKAGKHVYCEKPLTHTVSEARAISDLAKKTGLVTQMGNQIHSFDNYRRSVEVVQSGAIGEVREVHIWNTRTLRATDLRDIAPPPNLNYDLWLGPVPYRPYHPSYHPFSWRNFWTFGEGLLGDIFCHLADVPFWALDLKHPTHIRATGEPRSDELVAKWIIAEYDFAARGKLPPLKLTWYDPPKVPAALPSWGLDPNLTKEGIMFVGSEGNLYVHYGVHVLLPKEKFKNYQPPKPYIPSSPGHQAEWINACLKNDPAAASSPFSYGSLLTEAALLGVVAFRAQQELQWDAENMKFPNAPEAEKFLRTEYRPGWSL